MLDDFKKDLLRYELLLYDAVNTDEPFIHTTREIAEMLRTTRETVYRATKTLVEKKLIVVISRGHKRPDKRKPLYQYITVDRLNSLVEEEMKEIRRKCRNV